MNTKLRIERSEKIRDNLKTEKYKICFTSNRLITSQCKKFNTKKFTKKDEKQMLSEQTNSKFLKVHLPNHNLIIDRYLHEKWLGGATSIVVTKAHIKKKRPFILKFSLIANVQKNSRKLYYNLIKEQYNYFLNSTYINTELNQLVLADVTPHISLLNYSQFEKSTNLNKINASFVNPGIFSVQNIEFSGDFSAERYLKSWIDLLYKEENSEKFEELQKYFNLRLTVLIFQILFTLHSIHFYYPSFRHNDLHLQNIIMTRVNRGKVKYATYTIEDDLNFRINLQKITFSPMIIDFGLSTMKNKNVRVISKYMNKNQYLDINKFFNSLFFLLEDHFEFVDEDIIKFIKSVVPKKYRVPFDPERNLYYSIWKKNMKWMIDNEGRQIQGQQPVEFVTPKTLLNNSLFKFFRHVGNNNQGFRFDVKNDIVDIG